LACVEHGRLTKITNNPLGGPYMVGCVKGFQMTRALYAPDRLKKPLLRTGPRGSGEFKEVSWLLRLVTPHPRFRIHSQYDNIPWFKERERQALWIHPHDAAERGIENEQEVCVTSPEGRMRIIACVTEGIMLGVVCLLEGAWPSFEPDGADTAGAANVLTSTVPTLPSHGSRTHSVLVQVTQF
jgi:anaerobic selenocysteine-containing dehydrogenase